MRTTVELTDDQRARLLDLAARRGEKGFSRLVQEAIDRYLADEVDRLARVERALQLAGSFDDQAAQALKDSIHDLRGRWRS
jgi:hypothetical protein